VILEAPNPATAAPKPGPRILSAPAVTITPSQSIVVSEPAAAPKSQAPVMGVTIAPTEEVPLPPAKPEAKPSPEPVIGTTLVPETSKPALTIPEPAPRAVNTTTVTDKSSQPMVVAEPPAMSKSQAPTVGVTILPTEQVPSPPAKPAVKTTPEPVIGTTLVPEIPKPANPVPKPAQRAVSTTTVTPPSQPIVVAAPPAQQKSQAPLVGLTIIPEPPVKATAFDQPTAKELPPSKSVPALETPAAESSKPTAMNDSPAPTATPYTTGTMTWQTGETSAQTIPDAATTPDQMTLVKWIRGVRQRHANGACVSPGSGPCANSGIIPETTAAPAAPPTEGTANRAARASGGLLLWEEAPTPSAESKTDTDAATGHLRERIAAACGKQIGDVDIQVVSAKTLRVRVPAGSATEGQAFSSKIFELPELANYQVSLDIPVRR
jgi:hypothetical protein